VLLCYVFLIYSSKSSFQMLNKLFGFENSLLVNDQVNLSSSLSLLSILTRQHLNYLIRHLRAHHRQFGFNQTLSNHSLLPRIQMRFNCCGIDSLNDWKSLYDYRNPYQQISYYDKQAYQNNRPYTADVPDSCCKNPRSQCGKQGNVYGRDKSEFLNEQGCLAAYMVRLDF